MVVGAGEGGPGHAGELVVMPGAHPQLSLTQGMRSNRSRMLVAQQEARRKRTAMMRQRREDGEPVASPDPVRRSPFMEALRRQSRGGLAR